MLELTALTAFIGYLIYLRYYADQRTEAQKETDRLREGITMYNSDQLAQALTYFNNVLTNKPTSAVAYLYRARIYRALGDSQAALADLNHGKSYDDTIADLHIESGQIHYEEGDFQTAFQDFDKAIFHDHGDDPTPYRWRGLVRQHLQDMLAEQDLATAVRLEKRRHTQSIAPPPKKPMFFNRRLFQNAGLTIVSALLLLLLIKKSPVIHWPYLWAAASAVGIGFLEPRKGWFLAILLTITALFSYYVVVGPDVLSTHREVELFSLYGSIGLTFVGSFIGSMLRRAQA